MYELGFAHALRKPTILLASTKSDDSKLPADLTGFRYLLYDPANLRMLTELVGSEIKEVALRRSA
jgi:nucleoside 2-deoxyribosyltransferase